MNVTPVSVGDPFTADILNKISAAGSSPKAQTKVVSQQFEAILLRQFLDKSVGSMMGDGAGSDIYGYMLTSALASKLSEGGGMGLAGIFQRQLGPASAAAGTAGAAAGTASGAQAGAAAAAEAAPASGASAVSGQPAASSSLSALGQQALAPLATGTPIKGI